MYLTQMILCILINKSETAIPILGERIFFLMPELDTLYNTCRLTAAYIGVYILYGIINVPS